MAKILRRVGTLTARWTLLTGSGWFVSLLIRFTSVGLQVLANRLGNKPWVKDLAALNVFQLEVLSYFRGACLASPGTAGASETSDFQDPAIGNGEVEMREYDNGTRVAGNIEAADDWAEVTPPSAPTVPPARKGHLPKLSKGSAGGDWGWKVLGFSLLALVGIEEVAEAVETIYNVDN